MCEERRETEIRKRTMEKKDREKHSSEEEGREVDGNQIIRTTFKTDPLFHTLGDPSQIPKESMYSLSFPDTHHFLPLTHIHLLRNAEKG